FLQQPATGFADGEVLLDRRRGFGSQAAFAEGSQFIRRGVTGASLDHDASLLLIGDDPKWPILSEKCPSRQFQPVSPCASCRNRASTRDLATSTALTLSPNSSATTLAFTPSRTTRWNARQVVGVKSGRTWAMRTCST